LTQFLPDSARGLPTTFFVWSTFLSELPPIVHVRSLLHWTFWLTLLFFDFVSGRERFELVSFPSRCSVLGVLGFAFPVTSWPVSLTYIHRSLLFLPACRSRETCPGFLPFSKILFTPHCTTMSSFLLTHTQLAHNVPRLSPTSLVLLAAQDSSPSFPNKKASSFTVVFFPFDSFPFDKLAASMSLPFRYWPPPFHLTALIGFPLFCCPTNRPSSFSRQFLAFH